MTTFFDPYANKQVSIIPEMTPSISHYKYNDHNRTIIISRHPDISHVIDMYFAEHLGQTLAAIRYAPEPNICASCKHYIGNMCMLPDGNGDYLRLSAEPADFCSKWENPNDAYRSEKQKLLLKAASIQEEKHRV